MDQPLNTLSAKQIQIILYGNQGEQLKINYTNSYGETGSFYTRFEGVINTLKRRYQETKSDVAREEMEKFMTISLLAGLPWSAPAPRDIGSRTRGRSIAEVHRPGRAGDHGIFGRIRAGPTGGLYRPPSDQGNFRTAPISDRCGLGLPDPGSPGR